MVILDILHVELSQPAISQPSLLGSNGHPSDTNDDERSSTIVVVPQQSPNEMWQFHPVSKPNRWQNT